MGSAHEQIEVLTGPYIYCYQQAISRVDSRPKLERYLKRFCRRLICCEFFLSLKPVPTPCPDRCQADGGKELLVLDVVKQFTKAGAEETETFNEDFVIRNVVERDE